MARAPRTLVLTAILVAGVPAVAGAGVVERRPVTDDGRISYRDDLDFDDGFRLLEENGPGGRELVFERTTGTQPLRSLDPGCTAESGDVVRCRNLAGRDLVFASLITGRDVLDASAVRTFRVKAGTGTGPAKLTGGPLADELRAGSGKDDVRGGAGDDVLDAGSTQEFEVDDDLVEGGPGRDRMSARDDRDRMLARDGEADVVDCGPDGPDVAVVDRQDTVLGCEIVEYPEPQPAATPAPGPTATPAPQADPPPAAPVTSDEPERAADLRGVVAFSRGCASRRGVQLRIRPAGGFTPARTRVTVGHRVRARRTGSRVTVRLRRPAGRRATVRVVITGRDGRRLEVRRTLRRC